MTTRSDDMPSLLASRTMPAARPTLSRRAQRRALTLVLVASDTVMLVLAAWVAYSIRFDTPLTVAPEIVPAPELYALLLVLFVPLFLALCTFIRLYDYQTLLGGTSEYARVFNVCTIGVVILMSAAFLMPDLVLARGWVLTFWLASFLLVGSARFWLRRGVYQLRKRGYFVTPCLVVGANEEAHALAKQLAGWTTSGVDVLGLIAAGPVADKGIWNEEFPVLGRLETLPDLIERFQVEELVIAASALDSQQLLEIFRLYGVDDNVHLRLSSGLFDVFTTGLRVKSMAYVSLISAEPIRLSPVETFMKGCLDYVGAAVLLVLLSPLFAAIAVAIKRDSPGPVIYRRHVLGRGGTEFDAYKFRSMMVDGNQQLTPEQWTELQTHHKLKDDPRITRVGYYLRRYSLDELPQLVNVLKGQMSLIGPRMITPAEREKYGAWDMNLLTVKPGLSGLWQVSGRADVDYEERVRMDMHYIRNYTIWLDLQLILRTVGTVIRGRGAY